MGEVEIFERLGLALAIGLLVGVERGWHTRELAEGGRVAGVRTFALVGLLGGVIGTLAGEGGALVLAAAFLGFAALVAIAYLLPLGRASDLGITTEVATLLVFALGVLAARGEMAVAAAGGVVTAALLELKPVLHRGIARIESFELSAAIRLLVISVVLLPVLPDRGYGPGGMLNPYELWWMVVLVAAVSFAGYVAIKAAGPGTGALLTGLMGGIASSTAVTLFCARAARSAPSLARPLSAGAVAASAVMYVRILILAYILGRALFDALLAPIAAMAVISAVGAAVLALGARERGTLAGVALGNPFAIGAAVRFGAFLAVVLLLAPLARDRLGLAGLYGFAALAGLPDLDAVTMVMAQAAGGPLDAATAAASVMVAVIANTVLKASIAWTIGRAALAVRVVPVLVVAVLAGGAVEFIGG